MIQAIPIDAPDLQSKRCLPPYGRDVQEELDAGRKPNVYIFTGQQAWQRAKARLVVHGSGTALVLPVDRDPQDFIWPALDTVFADARWLTRHRAISLGATLIANGVRFVAMLAADEALSFKAEESAQARPHNVAYLF